MPQYFEFVSDLSSLSYLASQVLSEFTVPFTRTVAGGSDWEVDVINYRLKYVGTVPKLYQITGRFQQTSSTSVFRPNIQMFRSFPVIEGNGGISITVTPGSNTVAIMDAYPIAGNFINIQPNTVCGFTTENRQVSAGTSTDWVLTIYLNELR